MRPYTAIALVPLALIGCSEENTSPKKTDVPVAYVAGAADRDPIELYADYCLRCHGATDNGGMASSLLDAEWLHADTEQERFDAIKDGLTELGMPAYGSVMSDSEMRTLLGLIEDEDAIRELANDRRVPNERTRKRTRHYQLGVEPWVREGLEIPWGLRFIDEHTAILTERPGGLRIIVDGWLHPDPIAGTPEVLHQGQGGLMDVALDPNYEDNGWVYLAYSHALNDNQRGRAHTRIVRGRIKDHAWRDQEVVFEAEASDYSRTRHHYGSRIVFDDEGHLYFAIGDRGERTPAQDLGAAKGKVFRVNPDGSIPSDNPFVGQPGVVEQTWSYGHRNPQGMDFHPVTGDLWVAEHGPRGGDELNVVQPGKDYGWPTITYGINYNGSIITHDTRRAGMEQPNYYWEPSIAVCGVRFVTGDEFPKWSGTDLICAGLVGGEIRRVVTEDDRVLHDELILDGLGRVRDIEFNSEGEMFIVTNSPDRVWRVVNLGNAQR